MALSISDFVWEFFILFSVVFPQVALTVWSHLLLTFLCLVGKCFAILYVGNYKCTGKLQHLVALGEKAHSSNPCSPFTSYIVVIFQNTGIPPRGILKLVLAAWSSWAYNPGFQTLVMNLELSRLRVFASGFCIQNAGSEFLLPWKHEKEMALEKGLAIQSKRFFTDRKTRKHMQMSPKRVCSCFFHVPPPFQNPNNFGSWLIILKCLFDPLLLHSV